jgi:outer membrane immunogenic protein
MNIGAAGATTNLSGTNIGYNRGVPSGAGIEVDIQGVNGGTSFTGTTFVLAHNGIPTLRSCTPRKRLDWLSTVRGRLGWLATPTLLFYETDGFALGG